MPSTTQIIPEHRYPSQTVVINDNSGYTEDLSTDSGETKMLFVFASPRGEDGKIITIENGISEFVETYGQGPFSLYGQPYLNAYAALATGEVTAHCLRVTATNAAYSYSVLVAKYKVADGKMTVKFETVAGNLAGLTNNQLKDESLIETLYTAPTTADVDGFTAVKLLTVVSKGKGVYGDSLVYRIANDSTADKNNNFKNYLFQVYENYTSLAQREEYEVCFNEDALTSSGTLFSDAVVNDPDTGSSRISVITELDGFKKLFSVYADLVTDTALTFETFDALLGVNKNTKVAIENYVIDTTSDDVVVVNGITGISLGYGSDGDLGADVSATTRTAALNAAYLAAWNGTTDPFIKSKSKFPTNIILDAGYDNTTKLALANTGLKRGDAQVYVDCGTGITTKAAVMPYITANLGSYLTSRLQTIEAYCGKVKDPYSMKLVTVTGTFALATMLPNSFSSNSGKHVPVAGNTYGILDVFVAHTVYPVFDEDIDADLMDELVEERVNFARYSVLGDVIRATQTTRQEKTSNLSEASNVMVLLDVKRDCEALCARKDYHFAEAADLANFNRDLEDITSSYASQQVTSISGSFSQNTWEAKRSLVHLNVEMIHKKLAKSFIIELDVNPSA